jgi:hypothetical protein
MKKTLKNIIKKTLGIFGFRAIHHSKLEEWQIKQSLKYSYDESSLPANAKNYLNTANPNLQSLKNKYIKYDTKVTQPLIWNDNYIKDEDVLFFRGDNAYVRQIHPKKNNILSYALTTYYALKIDYLNLFSILDEDEYFGNYSLTIANRLISRDLLDSIIEIYFLEKHLNIISHSRKLNILDIGSGYGRLAHRSLIACPNISKYYCTDAVAISTFVSDYYIKFRKLEDRGIIVPLYNIVDTLKNNTIDIAINIHSFSECHLPAIDWWISLLSKFKVKYLMIAPNGDEQGGELLLNIHGDNFMEIVLKHGYKLVIKSPKYDDPVIQKHGLYSTYHFLFELQN